MNGDYDARAGVGLEGREKFELHLPVFVIELRQAADALIEAERAVYQAQGEYREASELLEDAETSVTLGGVLTGGNSEQRKAQLREKTQEDRLVVTAAEARLEFAKMELRCAQVNFRCLRTVAALFSGREEEPSGS